MSAWNEGWDLLKQTYREWSKDKTSQLGAALAYYALFAIAPLVIIAVAVAGWIFGDQAAQGEVARQLQTTTSPTVAAAIQDLLKYTRTNGHGVFATIISVGVLFVATLSFFDQLQDALNSIWGVRVKKGRGYWPLIRDRLFSFLMVLVIAGLLLASLVASTAVQAMARYVHLSAAGGSIDVWRIANWVATLILLTVLFALIFKWLPDVKLGWKDVFVGAALTALLFTVGNYVIGLYLSHTTTASTYGAAGSLVVVLLWVYYSSQVLLFGAEFTQVYANKYGRPMIADEIAEADSEKELTKPLAAPLGHRNQHALSH